MDIITLVIVILVIMSISLLATHAWVALWDGIGALLKKLFHIGKKDKINWHSLDQESQNQPKGKIAAKKEVISENERLY